MLKNFFKDYWKLCKQSNQFLKEHWKGVIVMIGGSYAAGFTGGFIYFNRDEIKKKIKSKFHKDKE